MRFAVAARLEREHAVSHRADAAILAAQSLHLNDRYPHLGRRPPVPGLNVPLSGEIGPGAVA
eukprot:1867462-Pleurochrysis_carterae.AAC.1